MSGRGKKQQQRRLRKAWDSGHSLKAIADDLGVSADAVRAEARRIGLTRIDQVCKARRRELALCEDLKAYWRSEGHPEVEFRLEIIARFNDGPIYGVRSNLVNGLPPQAAA